MKEKHANAADACYNELAYSGSYASIWTGWYGTHFLYPKFILKEITLMLARE